MALNHVLFIDIICLTLIGHVEEIYLQYIINKEKFSP